MASSLNLNSLNVDSSGRASFSGLTSGIDWQGAVDSIIAAKQIPIDSLKTEVTGNQDKITALGDVKTKLDALQQSLATLYGAVSFGSANDVFSAKSAYATSSRIDGGTASQAANLVGVNATNAAAIGSHTIEVLQTASAQKIASQALASQSDPLSELTAGDSFVINAGLGYQTSVQASADTQVGSAGTIDFTTIADSTSVGSITYAATDTLQDIADNINTNVSGVTASVVSSGSGVRLEITSTDPVDLTETGAGTLLTDLSVTDKNQITVTGSESLLDLRDLINNANTGVTASIASVSGTQNYLVLTNDVTGKEMVVRDTSGDALQSLGVLTAGNTIAHQLAAGTTAQFYADGLLDQSDLSYESALQSSGSVQIGTSGTLDFRLDSDSSLIGQVTYNAGDTLSDLAASISAISGLSASVVSDGAGVRLDITGTNAFNISESGAGNAISDLGINNSRLVIERDSNTINDLFSGMTLSLYQAEKGTTVNISVEQDLNTVKTAITNFVTAYNDFQQLVNQHRQFDPTTGQKSSSAGVLFDSPALAQSGTALNGLFGEGVAGVDQAFSVLAQIGITLVDNSTISDPTQANTLVVDDTKLNDALLNNPDEVRKLFSFDFQASDPRVTLLGFTADTTYNAAGYTLNVDPVAGTANINGDPSGADDGSASYSNGTVTVLTGGAKGLKLLTTGITSQTSVQLDYTTGFGDNMYFELDSLLDPTTGPVQTEISNLTDQNKLNNDRIDEMQLRLDLQRQSLLDRFTKMETQLATAQRILDSITQMTQSLTNSNSSSGN